MEAPRFRIAFGSKKAERQISDLSREAQKSVRLAIKKKLESNADLVGEALKGRLSGYLKLRVGSFRIIYEVRGDLVIIWLVDWRKDVYR